MKVDLEKAYNSVSWEFLDYMFIRIRFNDVWRIWIKACVFSSSMSVIITRRPTSNFSSQRDRIAGSFSLLIGNKGLAVLVSNVVHKDLLKAYLVDDEDCH